MQQPRREPRAPTLVRVLAVVVAALVMLGWSPSTALGDHGGRPIGSLLSCDRPVTPPRCLSVGNNHRHFVYFDEGLSDGLAASLRDTMAEDYGARTNLIVVEQARMTSTTDVIAFSGDFGDNGAAGWVYCRPDATQGVNANGDRWCRHQQLFFNLNERFAAFFADDGSRDHVACHELGHTLGLRHWGNPPTSEGPPAATCMNGNTPDGPTDLHQIDIDHINAYYALPEASPRPHRARILARAPADPATPLGTLGAGVIQASEVEQYASLAEITRAADAAVTGRILSVGAGRVFGIPGRSTLQYAAVAVEVERVVAGSLTAPGVVEITLEVPLFGGTDALAAMRSALPGTDGIFFLRHKTDAPLGRAVYRLAVMRGVILDEAGHAAVDRGEQDFLAALDGRPFDEVVRLVSAVNRR